MVPLLVHRFCSSVLQWAPERWRTPLGTCPNTWAQGLFWHKSGMNFWLQILFHQGHQGKHACTQSNCFGGLHNICFPLCKGNGDQAHEQNDPQSNVHDCHVRPQKILVQLHQHISTLIITPWGHHHPLGHPSNHPSNHGAGGLDSAEASMIWTRQLVFATMEALGKGQRPNIKATQKTYWWNGMTTSSYSWLYLQVSSSIQT